MGGWICAVIVFWLVLLGPRAVGASELPAWTARIRVDHPRLFFSADTWPAVRDRALGRAEQFGDDGRSFACGGGWDVRYSAHGG
ncbi:MAG TPA: hypothetical protein EYP56_08145 [Planctomycetaceae bacterium]|nr:hypothetical protein [Planctomycetaceae bacterium]HIQ21823.1 hypothetical protein [Planctomycetota bacterium]